MAQGVVRSFDSSTGQGIVVRDDRAFTEYTLAPDALDGSIFRTLRQGQRVTFEITEHDGQEFATRLRFGVDGAY